MIALVIAALVIVTTLATGLTLVDSWLRARHALVALRRERALLSAGFVPEIAHREIRLRRAGMRAQRPSLLQQQRPCRALRLRGVA